MPFEFRVKNGLIVETGGASITGSVNALNGLTGSLLGTASWANNAQTASVAPQYLLTSSYLTDSASFNSRINIGSAALNGLTAKTASYATTGSNTFIGRQTISGSVIISGSLGLILTGSLSSSDSAVFVGSVTAASFTGSLYGTSSWATNAISASYAQTASVAPNYLLNTTYQTDSASFNSRIVTNSNGLTNVIGRTASFATTGSNVFNGDQTVTGSLTVTDTLKALNRIIIGSANAAITSSNNSDIKLIDGAGNTSFRGVRANAWSDSLSTSFFQIGNSNDYVALTAQQGTKISRLLLFSTYTQIGGNNYSTVPNSTSSNYILEVLNANNSSSFNLDTSGNGKFSGSVTATSFIGPLTGTASWASNAISSSYAQVASDAPQYVPTSSYQTDRSSYLSDSASFNSRIVTNSNAISNIIANTASFATTGSNIFIGNETITGSVFLTGTLWVQSSSIYSPSDNILHIKATEARVVYDDTHYLALKVASTGQATISQSSTLPLILYGSFANYSPVSEANLFVASMSGSKDDVTTAAYLFGGASQVSMRLGHRGSYSPIIPNGNAYASFIIGRMTVDLSASANYTLFAQQVIKPLGINLNTGTIQNAATLYIEEAPNGGNNRYSLWCDGTGSSRFGGKIISDSGLFVTGSSVFSGSNIITGSITATGLVTAPNFIGTASWATSSFTASLALSVPDHSITYAKIQQAASHSILANTSSTTNNVNELYYYDAGIQTYTGTATWNGTAVPTGSTNHVYAWDRIGNKVTLTISLLYGTAGTGNTSVTMTLPTDCPTPVQWGGLGAGNEKLYPAYGLIDAATTGFPPAARAVLGMDSGGTGFLVSIVAASQNAKIAQATVIYRC